MHFEFNEEQIMIRDMVRDFAVNEIAAGTEERDKNSTFPHDIVKKAAELGLCGISVDEKYNGAGFDKISTVMAIMELARVCPSTAITLGVTNDVFCWPVEKYGTEEQKNKFLKPAAAGEFIGAFCLTEPDAGSDASNLLTKAEFVDGYYSITGTKAWVTNGGESGAYLVLAVTGEKNNRKEISAFIVPSDADGLKIGKIEDKMGLRASKTAQILFDDCRVPENYLLGEKGKGLKIALSTLDQSRIGVAAQAIGIAKGAFAEAVKYCQERETFGKPLFKHQAIQLMLSDMMTRISSSELLTYRAARSFDLGKKVTQESAMAKYYASESAKYVADLAVQIHGSYGYSREYPVERFYRDARVTTIYEGTSEIQKMVIYRNMRTN